MNFLACTPPEILHGIPKNDASEDDGKKLKCSVQLLSPNFYAGSAWRGAPPQTPDFPTAPGDSRKLLPTTPSSCTFGSTKGGMSLWMASSHVDVTPGVKSWQYLSCQRVIICGKKQIGVENNSGIFAQRPGHIYT